MEEEQNDVNILISIVYQLLLDFKEVPSSIKQFSRAYLICILFRSQLDNKAGNDLL